MDTVNQETPEIVELPPVNFFSELDMFTRMLSQYFLAHPPLNLPLEGGEGSQFLPFKGR
jgi:hypothetical protein